ncbi:gluconate 2-dehydrogenase subunit 3 family protein [Labrys wisconsinensis]|uniref:Gluconate 2-dehydrogenase gamma chain n=1 Tax=Labrys wisconsinensis TaxID=425677 RepID=A0ABU0JFT7_9HYPH|nr:gluconate 2-dehydrogenase subunit 3 family protein [Labrys wisconsinensis]MDQ0473149.1 gluconate 2-dehydrogenase gamma chain [Labrys wisconsinensis]
MAGEAAIEQEAPRAFDPHQRDTVAAAMARIIPSDETPGAREAGTIDFLERFLSGTGFIYAKPDGSGFETLSGRHEQAWRRRIDILRRRYAEGVRELDGRSRHRFGRDFVALAPQEQDEILRAAERHEAWPGGEAPAADAGTGPALQQTSAEIDLDFLPLLVLHTRQGFLADPVYGGNRDQAGWRAIGFPGPASLAEVHSGRYSTLAWFAEGHTDPSFENRKPHHGA